MIYYKLYDKIFFSTRKINFQKVKLIKKFYKIKLNELCKHVEL